MQSFDFSDPQKHNYIAYALMIVAFIHDSENFTDYTKAMINSQDMQQAIITMYVTVDGRDDVRMDIDSISPDPNGKITRKLMRLRTDVGVSGTMSDEQVTLFVSLVADLKKSFEESRIV